MRLRRRTTEPVPQIDPFMGDPTARMLCEALTEIVSSYKIRIQPGWHRRWRRAMPEPLFELCPDAGRGPSTVKEQAASEISGQLPQRHVAD